MACSVPQPQIHTQPHAGELASPGLVFLLWQFDIQSVVKPEMCLMYTRGSPGRFAALRVSKGHSAGFRMQCDILTDSTTLQVELPGP